MPLITAAPCSARQPLRALGNNAEEDIIHYKDKYLTCFFNGDKFTAFYWCLKYDQPDLFLNDFGNQLGTLISLFCRLTVRHKHMPLLCSSLEWKELKKLVQKQAQMPQTWSQFTYLDDAWIVLKNIRFSTFAKHKGQSSPSSVFIVKALVLLAVLPKQEKCLAGDLRDNVRCRWVH